VRGFLEFCSGVAVTLGLVAEAARKASMQENQGHYRLVVDGAIPMKDGGIYCFMPSVQSMRPQVF